MRFFSLCSLALSTLAGLVAAGENAIITPAAGTIVTAGSSIEVTWNPTTQGKVNLILRYGPTQNLLTGAPVASQISNSGSYVWNVPTNIGNGEWSIAITDGKDADTNYSPMFSITGGTGKQGSPGSTTAAAPKTTLNTVANQVIVSTTTIAGSASVISTTVTATGAAQTGAALRVGSAGGLAAAVGLGALAALA